jgi:uncharacterized protein (DUF1501 family)
MSIPNRIHSKTRRHFLHALASASACGLWGGLTAPAGAATAYTGKLLINVQLIGALDVTSFSDPKANVAGNPLINNWASTAAIRKAGNIDYAPFAQNAAFFDKYYQSILVVNGVDAQTNSHTVGILHNWSGRNSEGFPTLTALFAGAMQTAMPMPYLNFGGFSATQGTTTVTQIGRLSVLQNLVEPNLAESSGKQYVTSSELERIRSMHAAGLAARSTAATTLEGAGMQQQAYAAALERSSAIADFGDLLPATSQLQPTRRVGTINSSLHQQLEVSLLAFKAGVALAADVFEPGFDTHEDHDARHEPILGNVTNALDFCWSYAEALGIADRLIVVMGSDFGRTPAYNASGGKDHWPIGSVMVMQRNAAFTNRVVGLTDSGHKALKINPMTLQRDDSAGVILKPAHVHKALRKHLGIDKSALAQRFPFATTEDVAIFA